MYGNLFKSGVVSGIGSSAATGGLASGSGGKVDPRKLTQQQYMEIRAKNPELARTCVPPKRASLAASSSSSGVRRQEAARRGFLCFLN